MKPRPLPSLRTELLGNLAVLATAALMLAVASLLVFTGIAESTNAALWLTLLVLADVAIFVIFGGYLVRRLVLLPLNEIVAAAEAIAEGDLARRAPLTGSVELARLATSLNRMTTRLLEEQTLVVRAEKMASVGRLAAGIAHEIGNPLGAINGYTHIARRRLRATGLEDELDAIERETTRIDRIVRGLLDYARPRRTTPESIAIGECVERVVGMLRDQGALKAVEVRTNIEADVPELSGDRHELEQALVNLLLNAVDAMNGTGVATIAARGDTLAALRQDATPRRHDPPNVFIEREHNPRVRAWLHRVGEPKRILTVTIADSGPGVPPEDAERVFDPFFTTKSPGKGTGLGLAIVARIVDNLGGVVWVRPAREGGAAFVMMFPLGVRLSPPGRLMLPVKEGALVT
ncbi:MAG TPA: ATP-binding protein [Gemmatimonadaceae bacterium]|nr:ATP-binding protein [Gemmatimonadaceae bacterium]